MHRTSCIRSCITGAIAAIATITMALDANAFSMSPLPRQSSNVTLIAGGCGPGFHRGPYGGCRPNVAGYPAYGGVYRGGVWQVTLQLPAVPAGVPLAFAVWDGSQQDRDGRKYFSVWYRLQ